MNVQRRHLGAVPSDQTSNPSLAVVAAQAERQRDNITRKEELV